MLTLDDVASYWQLSPATVRHRIKSGQLAAVRIAGRYRTTWPHVWACESGDKPLGDTADFNRSPLLTKRDFAAAIGVSTRTIERWIDAGLPTRSIGESTRFNRFEVQAWMRLRFGVDVHAELGTTPSERAR